MNELNELDVLDTPFTPRAYEIWGQLNYYVWRAAFEKGKGKVAFDPNVHKSMVRAIDISVVPINLQKANVAERKTAETEKEWGLTQASILALGAKPSEINGKFVRIKFEPTGETYTNGQDEVKNKTYMKFLAVFATEAECEADYLENRGEESTTDASSEAAPVVVPDNVKRLLELIVKNNAKGKTTVKEIQDAIRPRIAGAPAVAQWYDADHPEVIRLIEEVLAGVAV
ncbi:MAG: hypothetical protein VB108_01320 [Anaerolineaceae bacterium]|nr:hypothetical protein [Anaerolineaceae bacterium]